MGAAFAGNVGNSLNYTPEEPILPTLLQQYERVIVETIITSFGLDMLIFNNPLLPSIADQDGGHVDTLHNVGKGMAYKNPKYEKAYQERGAYDDFAYHDGSSTFRNAKREARNAFRETGKPIQDDYTGKDIYWLGNNKNAPAATNASIDHVVSAHTILTPAHSFA